MLHGAAASLEAGFLPKAEAKLGTRRGLRSRSLLLRTLPCPGPCSGHWEASDGALPALRRGLLCFVCFFVTVVRWEHGI